MDREEQEKHQAELDNHRLTGYAAIFGEQEVYDGPANGGWIERIPREAFEQALAAERDIPLTINFQGPPIARTGNGTLRLTVDERGLRVEADLPDEVADRLSGSLRDDPLEPLEAGVYHSMIVKQQKWSDLPNQPSSLRLISQMDLREVSLVPGAVPPPPAEEAARSGYNPVRASVQGLIEQLARAVADSALVSIRVADRGTHYELQVGHRNAAPTEFDFESGTELTNFLRGMHQAFVMCGRVQKEPDEG